MYFDMKNYLKSNRNHTAEHIKKNAGGIWVLSAGGNFSVDNIDFMAQCCTIKITSANQSWNFSAV
jgi:hypothetical protein